MKVPLIDISAIPEQGSTLIDFFGRQVHVFQKGGRPRAVMNTCMHFGGPLDFDGEQFTCQWHGAQFDATGACTHGPAARNSRLMFLSTVVEDDKLVYVWNEREQSSAAD